MSIIFEINYLPPKGTISFSRSVFVEFDVANF